MTNKPKISIIIPAYNAERTIVRAVKGILAQTLRDLELWVVNDGSKDATGRLLDDLAREDRRLHVLHQDNAGAFAARLNGLRHATGEYFGFLDADDHVEPQMYEQMTAFAREHDLDIVQCDLFGVPHEGPETELFLGRQEVLDKIVWPRLVQGADSMLVWDKIYRNRYDISDWRVENYWTGEDYVFNWRFFQPVERVGYLHRGFYHYTITPSSSTRKFTDKTIPGMQATIRMRDRLARTYGYDPETTDFAQWVVNCVRNIFMVAASAPAVSFGARVRRARAVLQCEELSNAFSVLAKTGTGYGRNGRFLKCCQVLPTGLVVFALWIPKRVQLTLRDRRIHQEGL